MLGLHHTHKTNHPWLSACRDLLQLSKPIVGVVPVLGSQFQALVETAELIVDKVEQIHREKEAEMDLARKVCEIVRAIARALKENHYLYEAESLKLDVFEVQSCVTQALDIIVAKQNKSFTNRHLKFGSKLPSAKEISDRLDEKLRLFTFKSLINICCVQSEILRRMAPSVASASVPEYSPPEYSIRGRDGASGGLHIYSNKRRTRSPSPAIPRGSRKCRTRLRLEEDRSTSYKESAQEPDTCDMEKAEIRQKKYVKRMRTGARGRTKQSSGRTNASIKDVEDGHDDIDTAHHVPDNLEKFLGSGHDCTTLFQSTVSVWKNRQRSLSRERQQRETSDDLNVAHHRHDPSISTSERIGDKEKRKAVYFHDLPANAFKDTPDDSAKQIIVA